MYAILCVSRFSEQFIEEIVEKAGPSPHQIFNADETGLYYKCLPTKTSLTEKK